MNHRSPIKHRVRIHKRQGRVIRSYLRGSGYRCRKLANPMIRTSLFKIVHIDKQIHGDGKGNGYSGMNWYAAKALGIDYPFSQNTILIHSDNKWLKQHEIVEARKLRKVYNKKGYITLEDYYKAHAETIIEMGDDTPANLKLELPAVRRIIIKLKKRELTQNA